MTPEHYKKLDGKMQCPACRNSLDQSPSFMSCRSCGEQYPFRDGQLFFTGERLHEDATDDLKSRLKRMLGPSYHRFFKPLLSPSIPLPLRKVASPYLGDQGDINIEVGSGNQKLDECVYAIDFFAYANVDIVCDAASLPFKSEVVNAVVSNTVLEHVENFDAVISEMKRITKPQGINIHVMPFMYPFHASPDDFRRFTHIGFAKFFSGWTVLDQRPVTGPFTLFNSVAAELASMLFSFGSERVRAYLYLLCSAALSPLKFLDILCVWNRKFITVAPSILTILRKQTAEITDSLN